MLIIRESEIANAGYQGIQLTFILLQKILGGGVDTETPRC